MSTERGVTCPRCGASTPLPDDLRVASFACRYCEAVLETARYAGHAAVSADALVGHLAGVLANPVSVHEAIEGAPRFRGESGDTRAMPCLRCGVTLAVPLDLTVHVLTCPGCAQSQPVNLYVSDRERFELDMARQVAGNEALKRVASEGVPCTRCGGQNPAPPAGEVQLVCAFCGASVLLSDHVDASAIARHRLAQGVYAMRDAAIAQQAERDRKLKLGLGIGIALVVVAVIVANLL